MTLVVARVTPLGVRVVGDMRITNPNAAGPSGFLGAALKLVLLRPTLCVAYAGNVGAALGAIREVDSNDLNADDAERHLLDAHRRSESKADFLIASLRPSRLVAIKSGRAQFCDAAWIGDCVAYAEYERFYLQELFRPSEDLYDSVERAEDIEIAARMANGMEAVVHGPSLVIEGETRTLTRPLGGSHERVGEAIVSVVLRAEDNLFKYSIGQRMTASRFDDPDARGGFVYAMLAADQPGVGMIGLYFVQAQLGVLYAPLVLDEPERYSGVSRDQFVELVRLRHGIALHGLGGL